MGLNDDVDNEYGNTDETRSVVLDTPRNNEASNNVPDESIFTKGIQVRRLPELDAEFVMQKSKEDRLMELVDKSSEIEKAGGISRTDVLAVESIVEELDPPPAKPEVEHTDEEPVEPRRPLGNPKLYTEERSTTEYQPALKLLSSNFEKAYSDLKVSVIDLGNKLLEKAEEEIQEKRLAYVDINVQFNKTIIKFLDNHESNDLVDVKCSFTKHLKWADLLSIPLHYLRPVVSGYNETMNEVESLLSKFNGTKTGEFLEDLIKVMSSDTVYKTMFNFANNELNTVEAITNKYIIDPETGEITLAPSIANEVMSSFNSLNNIGAILGFIGTDRLKKVIQIRLKGYDYCVSNISKALARSKELDEVADNNLRTRLDALLEISGEINECKMLMAALLAQIGAVFAVYSVINKYMQNMSE